MEKWKYYRSQIKNANAINSILHKEQGLTNAYKEKIDQIDEAILRDIAINVSIDSIISIDDTKCAERVSTLNAYADLIDDNRLEKFRNDIVSISQIDQKNNVIGENMQFSEEWLNTFAEYTTLTIAKQKLNDPTHINFANNSEACLASINSLEIQVTNAHLLQKIDAIKPVVTNLKSKAKMLVIILPSILAIASLILIVIAIVVDMAMSR